MSYKIDILQPSGDVGFVEYKRAFSVEGTISGDKLPKDALITVKLFDKNKEVVRYCTSNKKHKAFLLYHKDLTAYEESLDPKREKLSEFGFPELVVEDINNVDASIHDATNKCWYSDNEFKAIIVSATDIEHGAIFDDGMHYVGENDEAYSVLEEGNYLLEVSIIIDGNVVGISSKNIIIGKRKDQLICRFNPIEHKQKMIKWSKENNLSVIEDLLPGYLNPYLGVWKYHMGLLKMYRANDICLFDDVNVHMVVYLIDETSTSYATELSYLQSKNVLNSNRFVSYHYDIGEAVVGKKKTSSRQGQLVKFKNNENGCICRVDVVNKKAKENLYYLDERHIESSIFDLSNVTVNSSDTIAIMGVIKPYQMDPKDFILKEDNTYIINNAPDKIKYTFNIDGVENIIYREVNLDRVDKESIGKSIFEFYNVFDISSEWKNKSIKVKIESVDKKGTILQINELNIIVK